jgi:hypothetical protein
MRDTVRSGVLRSTPDAAATARLVLETLTWFARHRHWDPDGAAIPENLAADIAVDVLIHALVSHAYLGPNGAGKTTTVEILEGFRQRTGGNVRVLGVDPADQRARLRERIGIVLQECGFPRQARVGELIDIWRSYYPAPRPLAELLALVELSADRACRVRRLSAVSAAGSTSRSLSRAIPTWCSWTSRRPASIRSRAAGAGRQSRTCARSARRSC